MEKPVIVRFHLNEQGCIKLTLVCPLCDKGQDLPVGYAHTGVEFACSCGEDIPLHVEALLPVKQELEELAHLIDRSVTLAI
jgi:hypothetical protein